MLAEVRINRVDGRLPDDLSTLEDAARAENVRNMTLLRDLWTRGVERFEANGAALFAAWTDGRLAGVGGTTRQTDFPEPAMRMRRFYIHPALRGRGIGRSLGEQVVAHALTHAPTLTCNARASRAAGPYWEALGFKPVTYDSITHILRVRET